MVPSSVPAGNVKQRAVVLCNVMMDQMFLHGHGLGQNPEEREGDSNVCVLNGCSYASS